MEKMDEKYALENQRLLAAQNAGGGKTKKLPSAADFLSERGKYAGFM